ncbi:MAG: signal peptidase I [Bryobacterales bacterium]|nr:signal peptidase I [Bryobacterales bacterium]
MEDSAGLFGSLFTIVMLAVALVVVASMWKVFTKAGKPGWAVIVPIYNIVVLLEITGKPIWWIILLFIPIVNFVIAILVYVSLAKCFGKGAGFAVGLLLLGFIFFPILGFGDARYLGPKAGA